MYFLQTQVLTFRPTSPELEKEEVDYIFVRKKTQTTFSLLLSEGPKEVSRVFKGYTKVRCLDGVWSCLVDVCSVSGRCQKVVGSMWRCLNDVLLLFKDLFIQDIMGKNFILEKKII